MLQSYAAGMAHGLPRGVSGLEACLLSELAHRTVNDFCCASGAVQLAGRRSLDPMQRQTLDQLARRLDALGKIQRLMQAPAPGSTTDLAQQLAKLCEAMVVARYADQNITLLARVDDAQIDAGQAWRILMIVSELLVNAARHAFGAGGGTVLLDLFLRDDAVVCEIRDDGRGWADGSGPAPGYGSSVVRRLVEDLGGVLETLPTPRGTFIRLVAPRAIGFAAWPAAAGVSPGISWLMQMAEGRQGG
jgi:two-component sensor histidine kinase